MTGWRKAAARAALSKQLSPFGKQRLAQAAGARFEARVLYAAARDDVLAIVNGLRAKWVRGKLQATPTSLLDLTLVTRDGQVIFADAKSFSAKRFGRSMLTPHQIAQADQFAQRGVAAGFIVHLGEEDHVGWYSAQTVLGGKDRQGFGVDDGVRLGTLRDFSLAPIAAARHQ